MPFSQKSVVIYKVWQIGEEGRWPVGVVSIQTDKKNKSGKWYPTNGAINQALVENEYLDDWVHSRDLEIEGNDDGVLILKDSWGEPIYQLEYERQHHEPESKGLFSEASEAESEVSQENPTTFWTGQNVAIAVGATAVVAGIGYLIYKGMMPAATTTQPAQAPQLPAYGGGGMTPQQTQQQSDAADQVPPFVPGVNDNSWSGT